MTPEQAKAAKQFAKAILQEAFSSGDVDYSFITDLAMQHGMLETRIATKENKSEWDDMDFVEEGDPYFFIQQWMRSAA